MQANLLNQKNATTLLTEEEKAELLNAENFSSGIMSLVQREKWLLIWVSKEFGGLDLPFGKGLELLFDLARTDGSLAWFVTLCSGANYFSKNLRPEIARKIFSAEQVCLGGSGMVSGSAQPLNGNEFLINGKWKYATGAPHLTHFTLNTNLGNEIVSFVLPKEKVKIIPDWPAMGMRATGTFSFELKDVVVSKDFSFRYDKFFTQDNTSDIPFTAFADLTLLVNYLGMTQNFAEKAMAQEMMRYSEAALSKTLSFAHGIELAVKQKRMLSEEQMQEIHNFGEETVAECCGYFARSYPRAGIGASFMTSPLNQVFRDFFTATQHVNFRKN